jgi:riboflavin-specific deaminase-like protein
MASPGRPEQEPTFQRIFPAPGQVTAPQALRTLTAARERGGDRPYVIANFICSADGRAAFKGRSGPLSDVGDRAIFHALRERVDAVLAGTRTMRTESYGRLVRDSVRRARREYDGLSPDPLACLITRSGDVPTEIPLFADRDSHIVVFTPKPMALDGAAATVDTVVLDPGELTLTTTLRRLREDFDVRTLLCEGGPTIFSALLREQLVDELFLTISPQLTGGGEEPTITSGPELQMASALRLLWVLERDGALFLRYTGAESDEME